MDVLWSHSTEGGTTSRAKPGKAPKQPLPLPVRRAVPLPTAPLHLMPEPTTLPQESLAVLAGGDDEEFKRLMAQLNPDQARKIARKATAKPRHCTKCHQLYKGHRRGQPCPAIGPQPAAPAPPQPAPAHAPPPAVAAAPAPAPVTDTYLVTLESVTN